MNLDHNTIDAVPKIIDKSSIQALNPSISNQYLQNNGTEGNNLESIVRNNNENSNIIRASASSSMTTSVFHNAPTSIVVQGSRNVHVGDTHVSSFKINLSKKSKNKDKNAKKKLSSNILEFLCENTESVTMGHIKKIRIGKSWKMVMRDLELSDPEIENTHEYYIDRGGIEEVIYQLLRLWIEKNGSQATVGTLCKVLHAHKQQDALIVFAKMYQKIPNSD